MYSVCFDAATRLRLRYKDDTQAAYTAMCPPNEEVPHPRRRVFTPPLRIPPLVRFGSARLRASPSAVWSAVPPVEFLPHSVASCETCAPRQKRCAGTKTVHSAHSPLVVFHCPPKGDPKRGIRPKHRVTFRSLTSNHFSGSSFGGQ